MFNMTLRYFLTIHHLQAESRVYLTKDLFTVIPVYIIVPWLNQANSFLTLIFQNSLVAGVFANDWKKANIVPIHKENDKQIVSNYRPVSLLPISSKIFEKLIFNDLLAFFEKRTCYLSISLVFVLVFTSCSRSILRHQRLLTRYGMTACCLN